MKITSEKETAPATTPAKEEHAPQSASIAEKVDIPETGSPTDEHEAEPSNPEPSAPEPTSGSTTMDRGEDPPVLVTPKVQKEIDRIQIIIKDLAEKPADDLLPAIKKNAKDSAKYSKAALTANGMAIVSAWACGHLMNQAKKELGHGKFGKWRKKHLISASLSERTSQRYMKLAELAPDVGALLEWNSTLRQAYIGAGIIPDSESKKNGDPPKPIPEGQKLLTMLTSLQKALRLFTESEEKLAEKDREQIKSVQEEINEFINKALN